MSFRVGAVLFKGRNILGTGYAHRTTHKNINTQQSIHAERACVAGLRHDVIRGADMIIVRINPQGEMMPIDPCKGCKKLLQRKGVRKVYCSSGELDFHVYIP